MKTYSIFNHTADIGVEIYGKSLKDLFVNAALAISDIIVGINSVEDKETRIKEVFGSETEDLWINYLREVLFTINGEGFLIKKCIVGEIDDRHVSVSMRGENLNSKLHIMKKEIKAVTYHQASVKRINNKWKGKVILDV